MPKTTLKIHTHSQNKPVEAFSSFCFLCLANEITLSSTRETRHRESIKAVCDGVYVCVYVIVCVCERRRNAEKENENNRGSILSPTSINLLWYYAFLTLTKYLFAVGLFAWKRSYLFIFK